MDMKYFEYKHLPEKLQKISKPFHDIAHEMNGLFLNEEEKQMGLRKLLEAKDCFVRANI